MNNRQLVHESRFTIHEVLKQHFGFDSFRSLQEDIINSILSRKDTLALMPTGGGKSLCYQIPTLLNPGMCLVISPLIALMKDQVQNLRKKNITAYSIYSGMSRKEVIYILKTVINSNCKFLYVSPERLETKLFKEYLPGMDINLIAVDEAHCISQWGYDFRPSYLRIAALREELPGIPVLALTASATKDVQDDICEKLISPLAPHHKGRREQSPKIENSFNTWNVFCQSFERANLSYSVFNVDSKINKIIEILTKVSGSAIVYCKSRKRTKEICELLQRHRISSDYYHAGLVQQERNNKQEAWIDNKTRVIVCTSAFGMGIDKPDVRTVIHADIPDCLENYYQEAGRAGRDSKKSYAVLLQDEKELLELKDQINLRFPSQNEIRNIYQAIANYLQIPTGDGEGQYYDFNITDFIRKFKFNGQATIYSLKVLEQEGWLAFNEQVFIQASARFTIDKNYLYEFEKTHPASEPVIKSLLRAYEGIFNQSTFISEIVLSGLLKNSAEDVKKQLTELDHHGIIQYQPQKDSPQLILLRSRIKTEDLIINMVAFNKRKEKFIARTDQLIRFVKEEVECRSRIIGIYFGDTAIKACGICDNCLRQKSNHINQIGV